MTVDDLPELKLKNPNWAEYVAFQYGAKADEYIVAVFEFSDDLNPADRLWIWSPTHIDYKLPLLFKSSRASRISSSGKKSYYNRFRPVRVGGKIGWSTLDYTLKFYSDPAGIDLLITCAIQKSGKRCRFLLKEDTKTGVGPNAVIPVLQPIDDPELRMQADNRAKVSRLVLRLVMGQYQLLPVTGMKPRLDVLITDHASGRMRVREKVELDESNYQKGFKLTPSKRLMAGRIYMVKIEVDLGGVFPDIEEEREFIPSK